MIKRIIAPSLLAADYAHMGRALKDMEEAGADWLHYDVMDGVFVPTISFGAAMLKTLAPLTRLPMDVHVMAINPLHLIDDLIDAGASGITFHVETVEDGPAMVRHLKKRGVKAGVTLNPATEVERLEPVLNMVDMVLVMTVNPGYGGQKMIDACLEKVRILRGRFPNMDIQVDGGINCQTIQAAYNAGANVIVAGSAVFHAQDPAQEIRLLREAGR
jgi:ribulose-phosphate 3-epimerase